MARIGRPPAYISIDGMKKCSRCKAKKPLDLFYKDGHTVTGYSSQCKSCRKTGGGKDCMPIKDAVLWSKYRIRLEDYERMYAEQEGKCYTCDKWYEVLDVDHCHFTGQVRHLLCGRCNKALGLIDDNPRLALALYDYLAEQLVR